MSIIDIINQKFEESLTKAMKQMDNGEDETFYNLAFIHIHNDDCILLGLEYDGNEFNVVYKKNTEADLFFSFESCEEEEVKELTRFVRYLISNSNDNKVCTNCYKPFGFKSELFDVEYYQDDSITNLCVFCSHNTTKQLHTAIHKGIDIENLSCSVCYERILEKKDDKLIYTPLNSVSCCKNKYLCFKCISQQQKQYDCFFCKQKYQIGKNALVSLRKTDSNI